MTSVSAPADRPPASDAINNFLVRVSIALHKHGTYPPGHPALVSADSALALSTEALFAERAALGIGVARRTLLVDGVPTDSTNAVVKELAERLHRREVGGIMLRRGVTADELSEALHQLSADPTQFRERLHGHGEPLPTWPHIDIVPPAFRRLALAEEDGEPAADGAGQKLWFMLAAATLDGGGDGEPVSDSDATPDRLARRINAYARDRKSARDVGEMLVRLGRYAKGAEGNERRALEGQVRSLVAQLSSEALSWLFAGQDQEERRALMTEAVDALPVDTVVELLKAASDSSEQNISHFMVRMLRKLAGQAKATGEVGQHGDTELRDAAREIVDNWTLEDPNPLEHTRLLDQLSQFEVSKVEGTVPLAGEGLRLMQIAIETNASGDHVLEAVELMLEARELTPLLDLLASASDAPDTVSQVRRHLASPEILRRVLLEEPIDAVGSQRLLQETGPDAAAGLVDALAISESQGTRRLILERLAAMGGQIAPLLAERLPRVPWYVQRNILALLARLKTLPAGFEARAYAEHPEVTVRFQALSVMVRQPKEREEAIHLSLADADPRVVKLGLDAAAGGLPRQAVTRLMVLINNPARPVELRLRAIRLLAQAPTPATRDWLFDKVLTRRTLFRGPRLTPKSPEMIAALEVLARKWRTYPQAAYALKLAQESGDPELVAAAAGQEVP
jgi:hypothetical protein